jgi:hypothetical protein
MTNLALAAVFGRVFVWTASFNIIFAVSAPFRTHQRRAGDFLTFCRFRRLTFKDRGFPAAG